MPATRATTVQQRQEMGRLADQGESYQAVANQTGVSFWTARKWIRRSQRDGLSALVTTFGRPATGPMSGFDQLVRYVALRLKCEHKTWGAAYVVKKMDERPSYRVDATYPLTMWPNGSISLLGLRITAVSQVLTRDAYVPSSKILTIATCSRRHRFRLAVYPLSPLASRRLMTSRTP